MAAFLTRIMMMMMIEHWHDSDLFEKAGFAAALITTTVTVTVHPRSHWHHHTTRAPASKHRANSKLPGRF